MITQLIFYISVLYMSGHCIYMDYNTQKLLYNKDVQVYSSVSAMYLD